MLALERRNQILKLFQQSETVKVSDLSQRFGVTVETIRRDLDQLELAGHIVRTHGGAMLSTRENTKTEQASSIRQQTNTAQKLLIAELIADMVRDGDDIMLDASSTSLFVARALRKRKNLTVITSSLEIILEIANQTDWTIMCSGGVLNEHTMSFVGNRAESTISKYHVDWAIISCKGVDQDGFTESNEASALVKRSMIESAKRAILAADSSKFGTMSFVRTGRLQELYAVVTDRKPDQQFLEGLDEIDVACIWPDM